jgi:hydrocephalus-inducing protein
MVNRSKTAVSFSLEECIATLRTRGVNLPVGGDVYLRAGEATVLPLSFRPTLRQRPFTEDVVVRVAGVTHTLLQVSGACLGVEAKLANEQVAFGPVVKGSRLVKHVVISNTGDVGTKFEWNTAQLAPHFSVVPADGFLSPNQDLRLEVHFHPTQLAAEIRRDKMRCTVEGGTTQFLTLTGACVDAEQDSTPVSFQTQVRPPHRETIIALCTCAEQCATRATLLVQICTHLSRFYPHNSEEIVPVHSQRGLPISLPCFKHRKGGPSCGC